MSVAPLAPMSCYGDYMDDPFWERGGDLPMASERPWEDPDWNPGLLPESMTAAEVTAPARGGIDLGGGGVMPGLGPISQAPLFGNLVNLFGGLF